MLDFGSAAAPSLDLGLGLRRYRSVSQALARFDAWLGDHLDHLRREPGDNLLSQLVAGPRGRARASSETELKATAGLVLAAGFETTVNLLGNGIALLHDHPDERARVVADPSLWTNVVEEVLRLDPPVLLTGRMALRDTEVAGQPVRAGSMVTAILGGANRDPEVFADPLRFDVGRANARDHIAFSAGRHHCLGAQLARMEGEVGPARDLGPLPRPAARARRPSPRDPHPARASRRSPPRCVPDAARPGRVPRCRTGEQCACSCCCCPPCCPAGCRRPRPYADDSVPRPVLNVDFPDPAVVATPDRTGRLLHRRPRAARLVAQRRRPVAPRPRACSPTGRRGRARAASGPSTSRGSRGTWLLYYATPGAGDRRARPLHRRRPVRLRPRPVPPGRQPPARVPVVRRRADRAGPAAAARPDAAARRGDRPVVLPRRRRDAVPPLQDRPDPLDDADRARSRRPASRSRPARPASSWCARPG